MWEKLYNALSALIAISVKVDKQEKEIESLKAETRELAGILHEVLAELRNVSQQRDADRREIALFIENQLLKFERRLPAGGDKKSDD
jgi:anaerobic ribonucleoside-triphosphate reductase